jgi:hypothetical protein
MSDYIRTGRECSLGQLKPELAQPIRAYAAQHALGNLEAESRLCLVLALVRAAEGNAP